MHGVVLAAGEGTRLRPLTEDKPKGMVNVAGKPLLTWCFECLVDMGVEKLVAVVGYRRERIVDFYGDEFEGIPIRYAIQHEPKGQAHALLAGEEAVDGEFVVMDGDNVVDAENTDELIVQQGREDVDGTLYLQQVLPEVARGEGVCELGEDRTVSRLVEKPDDPPSDLVVAGLHTFPPEIFDACRLVRPSSRGEYELSTAIDILIRAGYTMKGVLMDGWRTNVNAVEDIERVEKRMARQQSSGCT